MKAAKRNKRAKAKAKALRIKKIPLTDMEKAERDVRRYTGRAKELHDEAMKYRRLGKESFVINEDLHLALSHKDHS